jgi:hypothetical protein
MLNILPFQVLNLALIVDNTGFQVESLLGLAPKGNPRYLIGKESLRQKITLVKVWHAILIQVNSYKITFIEINF